MELTTKDLFKIDTKSALPLYYQIKQNLSEIVSSGKFSPGDMLPSENEMGEYYGVTRLTVRQAVGELVRDGILVRERGRGTFVAQPKLTHKMVHATGFNERIRETGLTPSTKVLSFEIVPAIDEVSNQLNLEPDELVYKLVRLRCIDEDPNMIQTTYFTKNRFPGLESVDFSINSLYKTFEDRFNVLIINADKVFEPVLLTSKDAKLLESKVGAPALLMEAVAFDQNGNKVEFTKSLIRGDKSRIAVRV